MAKPALTPKLRKATPDDAEDIAQLSNFAGEGMPLYLWEGMAEGVKRRGMWGAAGRGARKAASPM